MSKRTLNPGDRIALTAAFLKNTGQQTGNAGARRGTYLGPQPGMPAYGRVRWDDAEDMIASGQGSYAELDFCEDVRANGNLICLKNIARVGSAAFALNDV
jgi:hypothetical protein